MLSLPLSWWSGRSRARFLPEETNFQFFTAPLPGGELIREYPGDLRAGGQSAPIWVAQDVTARPGCEGNTACRLDRQLQRLSNSYLHFIRAKLSLVQFRIEPPSCQKFLMGALLNNRSFV